MKTVCPNDRCNGCMLCKAVCPRGAIRVEVGLKSCNACIDEAKCVACGQCERLCPRNSPPLLRPPTEWHQGWAEDAAVRAGSASGGVATALALQTVREGGVCVSCVFRGGRFVFGKAGTEEAVLSFRGSKYVKSDASDAYQLVLDSLAQGRKVLFVALPCQTAALLAHPGLARLDTENLTTVDLICHGTPSPRLLETFLGERKRSLADISGISFRDKTRYRIRTDGERAPKSGRKDMYMAAFMRVLSFTDNCYECPFSRLERATDLTLGDSWETELPPGEWERGVSLMLCQTAKGSALLHRSGIHFEPVDLQKAVAANENLVRPCNPPPARERFFRIVARTGSLSAAMRKTHPKFYFRNTIQTWLGL